MATREITSQAQLEEAVKSNAQGVTVLDFWVDWSEPCKPMNEAFKLLASQNAGVQCLMLQAENVSEISEKYGVETVPFFVFLKAGAVVDKLEGANAPELRTKFAKWAATVPAVVTAPAPMTETPAELRARVEKLVNTAPVMLFMKGTPDAPRCGFSRKMVELLKTAGAKFSSFDILTDEAVRVGLKEYANWPTYPQLYVKGKLVGGLDIATEMHSQGELAPLLSTAKEDDLNTRLEKLINSHPVMLFMKGSPEAPRCGFSAKMVDVLKQGGASTFGSFDILSDETVRNGLKQYSNWPTYPQLYVKGKLIGGLDIAKELLDNGELKDVLKV